MHVRARMCVRVCFRACVRPTPLLQAAPSTGADAADAMARGAARCLQIKPLLPDEQYEAQRQKWEAFGKSSAATKMQR